MKFQENEFSLTPTQKKKWHVRIEFSILIRQRYSGDDKVESMEETRSASR